MGGLVKKNIIILWMMCLFLISCAAISNRDSSTDENFALTGIRWELIQVSGKSIDLENLNKKPFVLFSDKDKRLNGHTGCNRFFGSFNKSKNHLSIGPIGMTHMACQEMMDFEMRFMKALEQTDTFSIIGSTLFFYSQGKPVAQFIRSGNDE